MLTCHLLDEGSNGLVNEVAFEFIPTANQVKNAQRSKTVKVLSRDYANESSGASIKARFQKPGPVHPHMLRHSTASRWPTAATTCGGSKITLGIAIPSTPFTTPRTAAGCFEGLWR